MTEADERHLRRAVELAAAGEQLAELRPPGAVSPDAAPVAYEGPALFDEARVPIDGYYDQQQRARGLSSR